MERKDGVTGSESRLVTRGLGLKSSPESFYLFIYSTDPG